jgi:hypothetical protein
MQILTYLEQLKDDYKTFIAAKNSSRFGWDFENKIPTAPDYVWDEYVAKNPKAKPYRYKSLPFVDDLDELCNGSTMSSICALCLLSLFFCRHVLFFFFLLNQFTLFISYVFSST